VTFRILRHTAVCLGWVLLPGLVLANEIAPLDDCDGLIEFDGRHYEVVAHNGVSWGTADSAAKGKTHDGSQTGVPGHLATITSAAEDAFVEALRKCARLKGALTRNAVWVGGFQDQQAQAACETDQDPDRPDPAHCGWRWLNNEGAISTPEVPLLSYSNWLEDEPNNYQGNNEQHLTIGHDGRFGWNDEGNLNNIGGYIIEYDTATIVDPEDCIEGDGCTTTTGQTLLLPPVTLDPDAAIGIRTYEFTDDPDRCGKDSLFLFDGALHIPPYLCGSPKFLVVEVNKSGFEVLQGTILVENQPIEALPGNLYECDGPIAGPSSDPQKRDVVAWQATQKAAMLENSLGAATHAQFAGAAGEFTFECGSSRGLTMNLSYLVIGMHINFNIDHASNPGGVHERFVALTRYKLRLLQEAVDESKPALNVPGEWNSMRTHVRNALRAHDQGDFQTALNRINVFLSHVGNSTYTPVPGENYQGEHLARGQNLKFSYETRVIPYAP
jgi:hypothetical protein